MKIRFLKDVIGAYGCIYRQGQIGELTEGEVKSKTIQEGHGVYTYLSDDDFEVVEEMDDYGKFRKQFDKMLKTNRTASGELDFNGLEDDIWEYFHPVDLEGK